ncbi:MAG TPA: PQQ-binding-like beta-propeller repeat protein [Planctomycetota bacterium]|nr:PQQ-binding-like beta-propeller repeat protein [Planctomycetota bacterium]
MNLARSGLLVLLLAIPCPPVAAEGIAEGRAAFGKLVAMRDGLLAELGKRQAADQQRGPAQHLVLRLDEGADRDDLHLVLRRAGGQWRTAFAEVPAWAQGTMQEWRGFHLANGAGIAWRPNLRFPVDASAARLDAGRLRGSLRVEFRLDQTLDEKLPPGEPVSWWDRFIPTGHAIPRKQSYAIDAVVHDDAVLLDLVLEGGVHWQPKKKGDKAPTLVERPIFARLVVPSTRFTAMRVQTPTWNGGYHEGDATGLRLDAGRITGTLVVYLHQDGWIPWGGGKTYQRPPQVITFELDARLTHHALSGTFKASGDMGDYQGEVRGRGGKAVAGRFTASGELGEQVGALDGMLLDDPARIGDRLKAGPKAGGDASGAQVNTVLHHIRALHLALQHYPLPLDEALAQTDTAAPDWAGADAAKVAAYCREALAMLAGVPSPADAALPTPIPEQSVEAEWSPVRDWRVIGPFEQRVGLENDAGLVPQVVPLAGIKHVQEMDRLGARQPDAPRREWQEATCPGTRLGAPWDKPGFYNRFQGELWYAAADIRSEAAGRSWLSLESGDFAKLWVNGRLVWADAEKPWRYRPRGRVVVPVELRAGNNTLLVRVHRDREPSWVRVAIATRPPQRAGQPPPTPPVSSPCVFPDATPPLAWDIEKGTNVAWRRPELGGKARPFVVGDALFVTGPEGTVHCLDAATGQVRWSRDAKLEEFVDPRTLDAWRKGEDATERVALLKRLKDEAGLGSYRPEDLRVSANADALFVTTQAQNLAIRFRHRADGKPDYERLWESNYEHGGFGTIAAPSVATEKYLFTSMPVLERGPHCPDARVELHVQDAATGRPLARLKPALENAVMHDVAPVVAGGYVFCLDSGGGTHGGHTTHGQVAIATADDKLFLVARNLIDLGTRASPVFAGGRMYLRSPQALTCIAVTTPAGKRFQAERLAKTLLASLGAAPTTAAPRNIMAADEDFPDYVPIGKLLDGRATEFWLGGGPSGAESDLRKQLRSFKPLSREHAFNDPPLFHRTYELQGTGDIVPVFSTRVDPRCVSSKDGSGVLFTVLDNPRDRIIVPTLKANGVTQWLAGQELKPDEPLHLKPGLYPYLVCIHPEYYRVEPKEEIPPVAVAKAVEKGALKEVGWPRTWQVFGPLPPDAPPLEGDELKRIPDKLTVGDRDYPPFTIPADANTVYLTSLLDLRPGQKPDVANAPKTVRIGTPSVAYAFATVECPADGILCVNASGDWFMTWYLDGEVVYDTMQSGNGAAATDLNAHPFAIRVAKGKHVLAVQVKPGSKGWSFTSIAGFDPVGSAGFSPYLADFRVPSKQKKAEPDFRFAPAFKEIPHPPTRMRRWLERARACKARLEAVVRDLPGTEEAKAATAILTQVDN